MKQRVQGFTLIELLIVIGLIGILAGAFMMNMTRSIDQARLRSAESFAAQLDRTIGDEAVLIWNFDECSGSVTADRGAYALNGLLTGGAMFSDATPHGFGCSANLDGSTGAVVTNATDRISFDNQTSFSMFAWVRPEGISPGIQSLFGMEFESGYVWMRIEDGVPRLDAADDSGFDWSLTQTRELRNGSWHHVGCSIDRASRRVTLYVDGMEVAHAQRDGAGAFTSTPTSVFFVGAGGSSLRFAGSVDAVRIYRGAVSGG